MNRLVEMLVDFAGEYGRTPQSWAELDEHGYGDYDAVHGHFIVHEPHEFEMKGRLIEVQQYYVAFGVDGSELTLSPDGKSCLNAGEKQLLVAFVGSCSRDSYRKALHAATIAGTVSIARALGVLPTEDSIRVEGGGDSAPPVADERD